MKDGIKKKIKEIMDKNLGATRVNYRLQAEASDDERENFKAVFVDRTVGELSSLCAKETEKELEKYIKWTVKRWNYEDSSVHRAALKQEMKSVKQYLRERKN